MFCHTQLFQSSPMFEFIKCTQRLETPSNARTHTHTHTHTCRNSSILLRPTIPQKSSSQSIDFCMSHHFLDGTASVWHKVLRTNFVHQGGEQFPRVLMHSFRNADMLLHLIENVKLDPLISSAHSLIIFAPWSVSDNT